MNADTRMMASNFLESEREALRWRIAELREGEDQSVTTLNGIEFLGDWIKEIDEELERREKIKNKPKRTGSYPQVDRFARVKAEVSLERFYEDKFPMILRNKGRNLWGLCPFPDHNEETPSFKIDPDRQNFYCFGCHQHGDLFHLAMFVYQARTNYEALCALEKDYGVAQVTIEFPPRPGASQSLTEANPYLIDIT